MNFPAQPWSYLKFFNLFLFLFIHLSFRFKIYQVFLKVIIKLIINKKNIFHEKFNGQNLIISQVWSWYLKQNNIVWKKKKVYTSSFPPPPHNVFTGLGTLFEFFLRNWKVLRFNFSYLPSSFNFNKSRLYNAKIFIKFFKPNMKWVALSSFVAHKWHILHMITWQTKIREQNWKLSIRKVEYRVSKKKGN